MGWGSAMQGRVVQGLHHCLHVHTRRGDQPISDERDKL
jgi:hypothetical protein